jgi:beta-glucosidase
MQRAVLLFSVATVAAFPSDDPRSRAVALLARMNLTDKIAMLHGYDSPSYTGLMASIPHLGIPALTLNDGRQGFRPNDGTNTQTAFPCQLSTVATFDVELMRAFGEALGEEFAGKGANVVLAPMLILARVPQGGRNFESIGEDPELAHAMGAAHIAGVQSVPGVMANADDFVLNNQETDRGDISSVADERTLFELYYRGYKGAVDAGVGSVMCSSVPDTRCPVTRASPAADALRPPPVHAP